MTARERQASVRARRKKRGRRLVIAYALRGAILLLLALMIILNEYSRPGIALSEVNGVVVHYTGNPGTTAEQNRSYYKNLAETKETYASSHFYL